MNITIVTSLMKLFSIWIHSKSGKFFSCADLLKFMIHNLKQLLMKEKKMKKDLNKWKIK